MVDYVLRLRMPYSKTIYTIQYISISIPILFFPQTYF